MSDTKNIIENEQSEHIFSSSAGGRSIPKSQYRPRQDSLIPPNINFYSNSNESIDKLINRPTIMELVDDSNILQQFRENRHSMELFQARDEELLESVIVNGAPQKMAQKRPMCITSLPNPTPITDQAPIHATKTRKNENDKNKKLEWIEGVLVRCMASIFGVMLYLRISWVTGQAGILFGSSIVLMSALITTITALSTSAICTNGMVKGGGAYFLISRSLGPEFGGSIGVIFSIANAVAAAMYLVGFAETICDSILNEYGIQIIDGDQNDVRVIALVTCVLIVTVIVIGLSFESKMQIILMVLIWASIADYYIGVFIPPSERQRSRGMTGFKTETLIHNLMPDYREGYNFFNVFAIYFPASTGIMAGANISGDLKDPQAIPLGTLLAIAITTCVYLSLVWMTGSTMVRDAGGALIPQLLIQGLNSTTNETISEWTYDEQIIANASYFPIDSQMDTIQTDISYVLHPCRLNESCMFGLMNDFQIVKLESIFGPFVIAGIIGSTLSSALASMVGAPKIFQAVCRDHLFPYVKVFGKGHGPNNEPRRALLLVFLVTIAIILIGNLNLIAPIISNFFLCSYALINYACFHATFTKSPGFRPSFKYYNMYVSLAGAVMCVVVMFLISWWTTFITTLIFFILYSYLAYRKPNVNWGSSTQANSYRMALQYVGRLERTEEHVKNYRPQVLVLSGNPAARLGLVDFAYSITKGNSLLICGYVLPYRACDTVFVMMQKFNSQLRDWFRARRMKAFAVTVANKNIRVGAQSLLQISGLGKLRPNILIVGFKANWTQDAKSVKGRAEISDYVGIISDAFDLNMSVGVLRNSNKGLDISDLILGSTNDLKRKAMLESDPDCDLPQTPATSSLPADALKFQTKIRNGMIDVWWLDDDGGLTLLIPYLMTLQNSYLEGAKLRVFTLAEQGKNLLEEQQSLVQMLNKFRIHCDHVTVIPNNSGQKPDKQSLVKFNALIAPFMSRKGRIRSRSNSEGENRLHTTKLLEDFETIQEDADEVEDDSESSQSHQNRPERLITEAELMAHEKRTWRHIRISELLKRYSSTANLIVVTLPVRGLGLVSSALYLAWLETISANLPPTLMLRGNHQSVLTFYS